MLMVIMDMNIMMIMIMIKSIMAMIKWGRDGHNDHNHYDDKNGNVYHGDDKMGARWSPCLEM